MRRTLPALLLSLLVILIGFVGFAYWSGNRSARDVGATSSDPTRTSGAVATARERGAKVGAAVGEAAAKTKETVDEAAITSKIKAKMVLDDSIKARTIDVITDGSTVTLKGTVRSESERNRATRLARETAGVSVVVDHLVIDASR